MHAPQSQRYLNRELSWLEFNQRVLEEARDPANPLLERVKFLAITGSNLDEFFEVRVAGLKQQVASGARVRSPDGLTPDACLRAIARRVRRMVEDQGRCWREELVPALEREGIRFLDPARLEGADRDWLDAFYRAEVRPVLTPLAIDPAHPFPRLQNKSLNLIVQVRRPRRRRLRYQLTVVQVPRVLPRLVQLPRENGRADYVFLGRLIAHYLPDLLAGETLAGAWLFRVTRNSELYVDEQDSPNLLEAVETEVHNRLKGEAVRLEVEEGCPPEITRELLETLHLGEEDLYVVRGPLNPARLMMLCEGPRAPELRDPPFVPPVAPALREEPDLFAAIRAGDVLLHHPYESFESVVDFLQQAAADPRVLAIKQTLYRTGGDARIIGALMDAVKNGKQVTAVVELRARFDESNNIRWARQLEEAGVHVIYGVVGYKIHCKATLVVRRDEDGIRRYLHLGTGNYNPTTARLYTDLGLLTCRPELGEDVTDLFNLITGLCEFRGTRRLLVAPHQLHIRFLELIRRETEHARRGLPARIIAKMNALVVTEIMDALYEASQAGVQVDLIVRGICCLRPGVPGLSENIRVRSIVGRFLEHSRIFYFENACRPEVYVGSADWMPRNFFKRIEVVFPIEDGRLRERIITQILGLQLADNVKARELLPDGTYRRVTPRPGEPRINSQEELIRQALANAPEDRGGAPRPAPRRLRPRTRPVGPAR
jgi:polyphosphate kinase